MSEEMSPDFLHALNLSYYNKDHAIRLYQRDLQNDPENYASWNNMGYCKISKGGEEKNAELIREGIKNVETALALAAEHKVNFPIAEANLAEAKQILQKITNA